MKTAKKLMAEKLKCPSCGAVPASDSWQWTLIEPATAYRRLAITVDVNGEITQIQSNDVEHDDGGPSGSYIGHRGCNKLIEIPKAFWDFDVYG